MRVAPARITTRLSPEPAEKKSGPPRKDPSDDRSFLSTSNDPVRIYLRKMGCVSLLTRDGEVEIAKRIEAGEHTVLAAILNSSVAVREIVDLGEKLRKHKVRVREIVRGADDETWSPTAPSWWPRSKKCN